MYSGGTAQELRLPDTDVGGESPFLRQNTTLQVDLRVVRLRRVVSDLGDLFYDETKTLSCPISLALLRGVQLGRHPFADDLKTGSPFSKLTHWAPGGRPVLLSNSNSEGNRVDGS